MGGWARGIALLVGAVLVVAGGLKLSRLEQTRLSLSRLGSARRPPNRALATIAAVAVGSLEVGLGAVLLARPTTVWASALAVALSVGFVAVVGIARRRGIACGCFSTFSTRVAGPVELARALVMLGLSVTMLLLVVAAPDSSRSDGAVVIGVLSAVVALVGARKVTDPGATVRDHVNSLRGPAPKPPWRRTRPLERRQVLRAVRSNPAVRDVEARAPRRLRWRRAQVAVAGSPVSITSIAVPGVRCRMHVLLPTAGVAAVICYTPDGVILPSPTVPSATSLAPTADPIGHDA